MCCFSPRLCVVVVVVVCHDLEISVQGTNQDKHSVTKNSSEVRVLSSKLLVHSYISVATHESPSWKDEIMA